MPRFCVAFSKNFLAPLLAAALAPALSPSAWSAPPAPPAPPASDSAKVLLLDQTSRIYGKVKVYIQPQSVKIMAPDSRWGFICAAPSWDCYLFTDERKLLHRYPYAEWSKNGIRTPMHFETNDDFKGHAWTFKQSEKVAGFNAQEFWRRGEGKRGGAYVVTSDIQVDPHLRHFLQQVFDVPRNDGVPLEFRRPHGESFMITLPSTVTSYLYTVSAHTVPYDKKMFAVPTNYKLTQDREIFKGPADPALGSLFH